MKKTTLLLIALLSLCLIPGAHAQWTALGSGLNNKVNTVVSYNNVLYAGGTFTATGDGLTTLNRVAKWNGSSWQQVGSGFDGEVKCLYVFNGELYASGNFSASGATATLKVAKWTGTAWAQVGSGFNSIVSCLYSFNGKLYAGGAFTQSGTSTVNKIAILESGIWTNVNSTLVTGQVNCITEHNGELYIAGYFSPITVLKLSGNTWTSIGTLSGPVYTMASFQYQSNTAKRLWIGGDFTVAPSFGICSYDGANYASPFNPYSYPSKVYAFYTSYSNLYSGGDFSVTAGTVTSSVVAKKGYNTPWDSVSATWNTGAKVYALGTYSGRLVAGGTFTTVNGITCTNIAMRTSTVGIEEASSNVLEKTFFPSPVHDRATLRLVTRELVKNPVLQIFDGQSRFIGSINISMIQNGNTIEFRFNRQDLASGLYYYLVTDEAGTGLLSDKFIIE